jgi:hypothetical protein
VFPVIGSLLFVLSFQDDALSFSLYVILVVMALEGGRMKMTNPTKMTTMNNITMIGTMGMDRKLYQLEILQQ